MHHPKPPHLATHTFALGVLTAITAPLVTARILSSVRVLDIAGTPASPVLTITTITLLAATFSLGWRRSVLNARIERAELIERIAYLEKRVEDAENAAWWGTSEQDTDLEKTIELGPTVVPFVRDRPSRQRGAS